MDDFAPLIPWLLLNKIPGLGLNRIHQLLGEFSTPEAVLSLNGGVAEQLPEKALSFMRALLAQGEQHDLHEQVKRELDYCNNEGVAIITMDDPLYPDYLREIDVPPIALYVRGNPYLLSKPQLAVVGSRKASNYALNITKDWCEQLSNAGLVITSGMALGIDGAAHQGALAGSGETIAVLAHGIEQVYPRSHRRLADAIAEKGALITEFCMGEQPLRDHFPRRNRIVSGLSMGVFVAEAAIKSGSLISARYALEQNRDVFALPGSIHNLQAQGCHQLIQQGAALVAEVEDIIHALPWEPEALPEKVDEEDFPGLDDVAISVLKHIPYEDMHVDVLMHKLDMQISTLSTILLNLELEGYISQSPGSCQRIR